MGGLLLRDPPGFGPMSNVRWMARRAAGIIMVTSPSPRAVPCGRLFGFNKLDAHDPRFRIDNPDGRLNSGRNGDGIGEMLNGELWRMENDELESGGGPRSPFNFQFNIQHSPFNIST